MDSKRYTQTEWRAEAQRRFGPSPLDWKFTCPRCNNVQSIPNFEAAGQPIVKAATNVYQYCIGNFSSHDCDWKAFGLFRGPVLVIADDGGREVPVFDFAEPSQQRTKMSKAFI